MKYPFDKVVARWARLIAIAVLGLSVQAFAQFEVAPDHFDSNPPPAKKQAAKATVKRGAATANAASKPAAKRKKRAAEKVIASKR